MLSMIDGPGCWSNPSTGKTMTTLIRRKCQSDIFWRPTQQVWPAGETTEQHQLPTFNFRLLAVYLTGADQTHLKIIVSISLVRAKERPCRVNFSVDRVKMKGANSSRIRRSILFGRKILLCSALVMTNSVTGFLSSSTCSSWMQTRIILSTRTTSSSSPSSPSMPPLNGLFPESRRGALSFSSSLGSNTNSSTKSLGTLARSSSSFLMDPAALTTATTTTSADSSIHQGPGSAQTETNSAVNGEKTNDAQHGTTPSLLGIQNAVAEAISSTSQSASTPNIPTTGAPQVPSNPAAAFSSAKTTSSSSTAVLGIGGLGGVVYDVNRLKRNLLQETMRAYKKSVWNLLTDITSSELDICEKLAALVQGSPVRTTTDSNLLEGTWTLAYTSKYGTVELLQQLRPLYTKNQRRARLKQQRLGQNAINTDAESETELGASPLEKRVTGKEGFFCTKQRTFSLEGDNFHTINNNVDNHDSHRDTLESNNDQTAHVVDQLRFLGGLVTRSRQSTVKGLTRTSLQLHRQATEWSFAGKPIFVHKLPEASKVVRDDRESASTYRLREQQQTGGDDSCDNVVQVVYLDVDLAILAPDGPTGCFQVFTKNDAWMEPQQRRERRVRFLTGFLRRLVKLNSQDQDKKSRKRGWDEEAILQEIQAGDSSRLRVLKIGDLNSNSEEDAWEGSADPFVHLSADERQDLLKRMKLMEIERASGNTKLVSQKKRATQWFQRRKKTFFRKPNDL